MQNFVFHNPTKVIFGQGTIPSIGRETAAYGHKVLLVYGSGSIKKNGIYQQVLDSLAEEKLAIVEHPGVCSNPVLSHIRQGIALAKEHQCQVICGVGGGSVIDEAKAISAGAKVEHDVWKFFTGKKSIKTTLPLTCVLTLAASGSEMNSGMVVTNDETRQKFGFANRHLYSKTSILDPEATFSVPADYTTYGAVDAIAHVLEFYFTTMVHPSPVQDRFMEGLVINAMESCNRVLLNHTDYAARAELMWTATLALNGLTAAGLGKVGFPMHLIEHSLSALYDIPHGAGLSAVIPGWMQYQANIAPQKFAQFGRRVFGLTKGSDLDLAIAGINKLKEWFEKVRSPVSLGALKIPQNEHAHIAQNAQALAKVWRMREYDEKKIREILLLCE